MWLLKLKLIKVPREWFYAQGQVIAAKCKQYRSVPDALTAEAYAYRDAMLMIKDLRLSKDDCRNGLPRISGAMEF
jgi:hypothetical protein